MRRKFGIAPLREGAYQTKRARGDGGTGTWSPPDESTQIRRQAMCKLRLEQNSSAVGAIECAETLVARHKAQVGVGSGKIRGRGLPQHRLAGMTVTTRMRMALRTVVATATDARGGGSVPQRAQARTVGNDVTATAAAAGGVLTIRLRHLRLSKSVSTAGRRRQQPLVGLALQQRAVLTEPVS